jgi:hypothetical protein
MNGSINSKDSLPLAENIITPGITQKTRFKYLNGDIKGEKNYSCFSLPIWGGD